jgi:FixJ family two-component response regulator
MPDRESADDDRGQGAQLPTVFIVDDDPSVRKALARLISSVGLRVETFEGAAEFLSRAPVDQHGCLLLDIRMQKMSGLELQARLRPAGIALPVIVVSAHTDVPVTVRAMKAGAIDVLTKPFQDHALLDAVQGAIAADEVRLREHARQRELQRRYELLTPRERTVMSLVVTGHPNKQVADLMGTSEKTVKVHRARVMAKMQAHSLPHLVRQADRLSVSVELRISDTTVVPKVQ